jgi:hypothetical protein
VEGVGVQATSSARPDPAANLRPVLATLVGIPAAAIVVAAVNGTSLPIVGDGVGAVIGLWLLGSVMCAFGISAMRDRFGVARAELVGLPFGLVATALLLSGVFGWTLLLQPIADAMAGPGGSVSLQRAAIVGVGAVMVAKWAIAWLSYLPRARSAASPA